MPSAFSSSTHMVMAILLQLTTNEALIRAVYNHNGISQDFEALHSDFGLLLHTEGLLGYLVEARPANACQPIRTPPLSNSSSVAYVALIQRYDCPFTTKVLHAQRAGYHAAVVHNVNSQALVIMQGEKEEMKRQVSIPSMFISESASTQLKRIFHYDQSAYVILFPKCSWLSCWDQRYRCQDSAHPARHQKQTFPCLSSRCHIISSVHYILFGLTLVIWIVALYVLCYL